MAADICAYMNISMSVKIDFYNKLAKKFEQLDTNMTIFERALSPIIHQWTVAKCTYKILLGQKMVWINFEFIKIYN